MADFEIRRAARQQARLRLALAAPSGGGKTWSSLVLAKGLVESLLQAGILAGTVEGKIGVIDTERQSADLYSHLVPFDTISLDPPYTVDRYLGALRQMERAGYAVVIIDQVTHAWSGVGGILEVVQRATRGGNSFNGWATGTPEYQRFVDGLLSSRCHLICTMRQKTSWELEDEVGRDGKVRKVPRRIGLAPEQRAGFEYEFTTVLGLQVNGNLATTLKDRSGVFPALGEEPVRLSDTWGARLAAWLTEGAALAPDENGDPLERLRAVTDMGKRRMAACRNAPDLARVFEALYREVRRFSGEIEASQVQPFLDEVVAAKDVEKARYAGSLNDRYTAAAADAQAAREEARRVTKPTPNGAAALVDAEHQRRHGKDLLTPDGGLATMDDDLPWKD